MAKSIHEFSGCDEAETVVVPAAAQLAACAFAEHTLVMTCTTRQVPTAPRRPAFLFALFTIGFVATTTVGTLHITTANAQQIAPPQPGHQAAPVERHFARDVLATESPEAHREPRAPRPRLVCPRTGRRLDAPPSNDDTQASLDVLKLAQLDTHRL